MLRSRALSRLALAVAAIPPAFIAWTVAREAVNVPFADEWHLLPFVERAIGGTLRVRDLWAPLDVHRMVPAKVIILGLARLTAWDVRYELAANIVIALATLSVLAMLIVRTAGHLAPALRSCLVLGASLMVFSPLQFQNWFWGIEIASFTTALATALTAWSIARLGPGWPGAFLAMLSASAGAVNQASGLVLLAIAPLGLLLHPRRLPGQRSLGPAIVTAALGAALAALYVTGLHPTAPVAGFDPVQHVVFVLAYLGAPLGMALGVWSALWGVAGLAMLAVSTVRLWRRAPDREAVFPWLLLALYPIGAAAMTAIGRVAVGLEEAVAFRYTTVTGLFWLSVAVTATLAIASLDDEPAPARGGRSAWLAAAAVVVVLAAVSYATASLEAQKWLDRATEDFARSRECVRLYRLASDDCLKPVHPIKGPSFRPTVEAQIARLEELRLGPFAALAPEPSLASYPRAVLPAPPGWIDTVALEYRGERPFHYVISGWSVDRVAGRPAPAVLAVVDGHVVGRATTGSPRADVMQALRDDRLLHSGWTFRFGAFVLTPGRHTFEAYAVFPDRRIAPLAGAFDIDMVKPP